MIEIQPPQPINLSTQNTNFTLFLAGSIEMGKADNWQAKSVKELERCPINILNPRKEM